MVKKVVFIFTFSLSTMVNSFSQNESGPPIVLVIHGGAGVIKKSSLSDELEKAYRDKMQEALDSGYQILEMGGSSLDAVEKAINVLEDSPLFNAGKGAVFTNDGKNELDASIMDGSNLKAGAVAGVQTIKNPISAARVVMEKSPHVMMTGDGAERFAKEQNLEIVDTSYFFDQKRYNQWKRLRDSEKIDLDHGKGRGQVKTGDEKFGTVGAVALDRNGNLAAGTSTGGMTNKKYGRVGDSPIIGAGTYANNKTCAVSCTGHGEYFIRSVVAYDVSALMEYKGLSINEAANEVVLKKLIEIKGEGGLIALDQKGNFAMPFNTEGMFRAFRNREKAEVKIYKED